MSINVENLKEVEEALSDFPNILKQNYYRRFQLVANKEEKILKSTTGFRDRTGRLRSELFAVALYNPLSIEIGTYTPYASYVAYGHGTWRGGWWVEYIKGLSSRLPTELKRILSNTLKDFNEKYSSR